MWRKVAEIGQKWDFIALFNEIYMKIEVFSSLEHNSTTHWTYLLQILSKLCSLETMKLWLFALTKTLFLMTFIIKLTLGNIFIKVKNPPGGTTVTK